MYVSINNSLSITGQVASLQFANTYGDGRYADASTDGDSIDTMLLKLARSGTVSDLKRAVATACDLLGAVELTLRDVNALVNERFWTALGIDVEAEFSPYTTGHGIIEDTRKVRLLVKTAPKEVA
jgi:hypothetical protein